MVLPARVSRYLSRAYRILFLIIGFVLFSLSSPLSASAQTYTPSIQQYTMPATNPDVPKNQHTLVQSLTIEVLASLICQLSGVDVVDSQRGCLTVDSETKKIGYADPKTQAGGGLIGFTSQMIGGLYQPPASGIYHTAYLASHFSVIKDKAYAQGTEPPTGFNQLEPVQKLWVGIRNMSYLLFVAVFVVIGIGIMLRVKIDPRTVMSIQNQLPKVVVTLLFITFSYAIVGFMIDMMWLGTYIGINTLTLANNPQLETCDDTADPSTLKERAYFNILNFPVAFFDDMFKQTNICVAQATDGTIYGYLFDGDKIDKIFNSGIASLSVGVGAAIGTVVNDSIVAIVAPEGTNCEVGWFDTNLSGCIEKALGWVLKWVAGVLGFFIALVAILVALFRLWWSLLKAYAFVIIYTILAPFYILMGLVPGNSLGFAKWFRNIVANLAVFPAAALFIIAARIVFDLYGQSTSPDPNAVFVAPLIGNPMVNVFGPLLALGLLLLLPEVLNMLRDALQAPASKYGDTVKTGFAVGSGAVAGFVGGSAGFAWNRITGVGNLHTGAASGFARRWALGTTRDPGNRRQRFFRAISGGGRAFGTHEATPTVNSSTLPTGGGGH